MRPELNSSEEAVVNAIRELKRATGAEIKKASGLGKNNVYHVIRSLELAGLIEVIGITPSRGSGRRAVIYGVAVQ
jgi:sugar-specific transcriptional regulator TrmB